MNIPEQVLSIMHMSENTGLQTAVALLLREAENEPNYEFRDRLIEIAHRVGALRKQKGDGSTEVTQNEPTE